MALLRAFALALLLTVTLAPLFGCNTIRGFGRDVEGAGSEISEEAAETQQEIRDK